MPRLCFCFRTQPELRPDRSILTLTQTAMCSHIHYISIKACTKFLIRCLLCFNILSFWASSLSRQQNTHILVRSSYPNVGIFKERYKRNPLVSSEHLKLGTPFQIYDQSEMRTNSEKEKSDQRHNSELLRQRFREENQSTNKSSGILQSIHRKHVSSRNITSYVSASDDPECKVVFKGCSTKKTLRRSRYDSLPEMKHTCESPMLYMKSWLKEKLYQFLEPNCTYYKKTNTVYCQGENVTAFPTDIQVSNLSQLIFDKISVKTIDKYFVDSFPDVETLAVLKSSVMQIDIPALVDKVSKNLIIVKNSLSTWTFSNFYSENTPSSGIHHIDVSSNQIRLSVSKGLINRWKLVK